MGKSSFKKISKNEFRGWMREEIFDLLPPTFFEDPVSSVKNLGGEVIKESKLRWAAILTLPNGKRIFLKRDRTKGWIESLKFLLLLSKGRREWIIADRLQKKNFNIPHPWAEMEKAHRGFIKESYYLSEAIGFGASFIDDPVKVGDVHRSMN